MCQSTFPLTRSGRHEAGTLKASDSFFQEDFGSQFDLLSEMLSSAETPPQKFWGIFLVLSTYFLQYIVV